MKDELVGENNKRFLQQTIQSFDHLCISPFREHYLAGTDVRQLGLSYGKLVWNESLQLDLFSEPEEQISEMELNYLIDKIRQKFGFQALIHTSSLLEGATAIHRSGLVGGHAGGNVGLGG